MTPQPPASSTARQRSQAATRRRLILAAAALFARDGGPKTTIAMTARRAGVAVGTVYLHFADKDALLKEVMMEALGELKRCLAAAAAGGSARTLADDVQRRTEGLVLFATEHRELAAVLFDPGNLGTDVGADVLEYLVESQAGSLVAGQRKGWLRADLDTDLAARALVGSLVLVLRWWVTRGGDEGPGPGRHEIARQLAGLRLYGTAAR